VNEKDLKDWIYSIEKRLFKLERDAHPPRDFVKCEDCLNKIKEKNGTKET